MLRINVTTSPLECIDFKACEETELILPEDVEMCDEGKTNRGQKFIL
jgi:hypothetical protein